MKRQKGAVKINTPLDGATLPGGTPPTFIFDSNCNVKFGLQFSPISDFSNPKKVIVFTVVVSSKGTEDWMSDTISGTMNLIVKMDIPAYGIIGRGIKVISTLEGTWQSESLLSLLEGVSPKEERLFLNTLVEELSKVIRAGSQLLSP